MDTVARVATGLRPELPHGSNKLPRRLLAGSRRMDTVAMVATPRRCPVWELPLVRLLVWVYRPLPQACHRCTMALAEALPRRLRARDPHLRYVFHPFEYDHLVTNSGYSLPATSPPLPLLPLKRAAFV